MKRILYLLLACFFLAASIAYAADIRWRNSKTALDSISGLQNGERGLVIGDNDISQLYRYDGSKWVEAPVASAGSWTTARLIAGNSVNGSANVPFANKFIVQGTSDAGLTGAQFLGALGTGLLKNTTTTGILSIAAAKTDYAPATSGSGILKGDGSGGFDNATYTDVVGLWATCAGYLKHDGTCDTPAGGGDNETLVNRLVDADHADNNATNSETRSDASVTPAALAYWSQNTLTTRLLAWLNGGTITGLNIGDGNATIDNSGNLLARTVSYIRDDENPFCQQYFAGTNYDDNYTEVCAPPEGFSETYRLYWPTAAPTGNQVLVFPAPTLGVSRGTWQNLAGGGDLVSTNNLSDLTDAETARSNLGLVIGTDVLAPNGSAALLTDFPTITEPILNIALRGGGSAITTGSAGNKRIASAATITGYAITSSASCSITVDLWKTTYTAYDVSTHPVDGDSITASAPITLTTSVKAKDETLTGWTKTLSADDIIHVNVDSADCTGDVDIQVYGTRSL